MAQGRKTNGGNGVLIVLGILILAAMIAVILGFCTNWYRDWTRFGIGGGEQQEVVYDRVEREEAVKIDSFHVEIIHLAGLRRLSFTSCRRMW